MSGFQEEAEISRNKLKDAENQRFMAELGQRADVRNWWACPEWDFSNSKKQASKTPNRINGFRVLELSRRKTGQNHRRSKGGGRWKAVLSLMCAKGRGV